MKTSEVFPSRFVKAEDLDHDLVVKIKSVVLEEVYDQQGHEDVEKPVAYFDGGTKGLLLNKTNWSACAALYGDESDAWVGKPMLMTTVEVQAFGDIVRAIRLKAPKQ